MHTTPAYSAPEGITPALARLHHVGGYDSRTFAVAILHLVAEEHLAMSEREDGTILLERLNTRPPKGAAARSLLRHLSKEDGFVIGRENYSALLHIRNKHRQRLGQERAKWAGDGGIYVMAGIGITILLLMLAVGILARQPANANYLGALLPYWPVAALGYGALFLVRFWRRKHREGKGNLGAHIEGYRYYLEVAMADRLNPHFMPGGANSELDPETVYAAAFGFDNTWADPLVTLVENLLPNAPDSLQLYGAIERGKSTNKRDRAPRNEEEDYGNLFR